MPKFISLAMHTRIALCAIVALTLLPFYALTQAYLRSFQEIAHLPTSTIYDLHIDRMGMLWLGTDKGAFRFNGQTIERVPFKQAKQMEITYLQEDEQGYIWGNNFASQIFRLDQDTLRPFINTSDVKIKETIQRYLLTPKFIWVLTANQLYKLAKSTRSVVSQIDLSNNIQLTEMQIVGDTLLFFNIEGEVWHLHQHTEQFRKSILPIKNEVRSVTLKNKLWLLQRQANSQAAMLNSNYRWEKLPKPQMQHKSHIYHIVTTDERDLWICTREGGYMWQPLTGKITEVFSKKNISDIVRDYQGNYWVATLDEGLFFCPSLATLMYNPFPFLENTTERLYSITPTSQPYTFWVGTSKGNIFEVNLAQNKFRTFEQTYFKHITHIKTYKKQDTLWTTGGIYKKDGTNIKSFTDKSIKDLRISEQLGLLLVAQSYEVGITFIDELIPKLSNKNSTTESLKRQQLKKLNNIFFKKKRVYTVELDEKREKIWVSYDDNLCEYDFKGNYRILKTPQDEPINARRLALDKEGKLYVATFNQGIFIIENQKVIKHFNTQNILKTDITKSIKNYNDTIWVATDEELGYLTPQTFEFIDVLNDNAIGKINYQDFCVHNNKVWLTSNNKIIAILIDRVVINQSLKALPIQKRGNSKSPTFIIKALNYKHPEQTFLFYRIVGLDDKWQKMQTLSTKINYSSLPNGYYTLEYYAWDRMDNIYSPIQKYTWIVPKQWHQTWYFYLIVATFIGFFLYIIINYRIRIYKKQQKQKENLLRSQLTALRSQMNPHFLYNVLNTVQGLVYENQKRQAGELLGDFSDLMRKILQHSESAYINLQQEIDMLQLYLSLEKARLGADMEYTINLQHIYCPTELTIPSMLIQPFIENAVKHGLMHKQGDKWVSVHFQWLEVNNLLEVVIEDNGIGRTTAAEIQKRHHKPPSEGFATQAISQRIVMLNAMQKQKITWQIIDKYDAEQIPQGTIVKLQIPILS